MKTPPTALIPAAILAAALPISSCSWHFGDRVREAHVLYTGADISRPVDGKVYALRSDRNTLDGQATYDYYVLAPEVTYNTSTPLAAEGTNLLFGYETGVRNKRDTGKYVWCEVLRGEAEEVTTGNYAQLCKERGYKQTVAGLPQGARLVCTVRPQPGGGGVKPLRTKRETGRWHTPVTIAAAPLDYAVDPALSIATTPFYIIGQGIRGVYRALSK